jgi:hypothetical protein
MIVILHLSSHNLHKNTTDNPTALNNYRTDLNLAAALRESLISYLIDFPVTTSDHIKLQASTLAALTAATNQLTRLTLVNQLDTHPYPSMDFVHRCRPLNVALL